MSDEKQESGLPENESLRDRIAKVLHRQYGPSLGATEMGWDYEPRATQEVYLADADAVIAELHLKQLVLDTDDAIGKRRFRCLATPWELIAEEQCTSPTGRNTSDD